MGTVRGKLGDNVMYVKNGEQCHRKLRKNIYNPKTAKQIYQRSIMATVMLAYSQGKEIFDHSFQGKKVPSGSQQKFMSDNLRLLRQKLAADINNARLPEDCTMSVVAPKSYMTVPNAYKVSEGTLLQNLFTYSDGRFLPPSLPSTATFAGFCNQYGVRPGDIFTFIAFGNEYGDATFDSMPDGTTLFGWVRLVLKNLAADFAVSSSTKISDLFVIQGTGNLGEVADRPIFPQSQEQGNIGLRFILNVDPDTSMTGALACIRSREDSKVRSTEFMHLVRDDADTEGKAATGITAPHIYTEWTTGGIDADSQLILEGGEGYRGN